MYGVLALSLITEYENRLLGKSNNLIQLLNQTGDDPVIQDKKARIILKFVFEEIFHWTPDEAADMFSKEVIDKMQLQDVVKKITFPPEMDRTVDFYYYVWRVYPKSDTTNTKERTLKAFRQRIAGERKKLPKEFFTDRNGMLRAEICFNYVLGDIGYTTIKELYELMSNWRGMAVIRKYGLQDPCMMYYKTPVDYLHHSLATSQRNEFFCQYYAYEYQENKVFAKSQLNNFYKQ